MRISLLVDPWVIQAWSVVDYRTYRRWQKTLKYFFFNENGKFKWVYKEISDATLTYSKRSKTDESFEWVWKVTWKILFSMFQENILKKRTINLYEY